jgi:hypothetical protein
VSGRRSFLSSRASQWRAGRPRPAARLEGRDARRSTVIREVRFDFLSQCPVDLPGCCFCSFSKLGSRMIVGRRHVGLWEAGANPALPRNC